MSIARDIARGLQHLERELDHPVFTWDGEDYPCTLATRSESRQFGAGGVAPIDGGILYVRIAALPASVPQVKDLIDVDGKTFRIDQVDHLPGQSALRITYNDPNRGS